MAEDLTDVTASGADPEAEFAAAVAAAEAEPADDERWDILEEISEELSRADTVGEVYRRVLAQDLPRELTESVGQRAVQFHEEWFAEDSPHLVEVLDRVLTLDPEADWALQRVTVVLTDAERWPELLAHYDRALAATRDEGRREQLLDEAAQLAKDFAGAPDRAIEYLTQLLELRPKDSRLVSSLERLLERQSRHEELIALWRRAVARSKPKKAMELRGRIAACYLDHLQDASSTLNEVRGLLEDGAPEGPNLELLERVIALDGASAEVRSGALDLLRARYEASGRSDEVVRALGVALGFASGAEEVVLRRELGTRLAQNGDLGSAMEHWASVLHLDPSAEDAQDELARLADASDAHARYADALVHAASVAGAGPRQSALLTEAGDVRGQKLGDRDAAIELYQRVIEGDARPAMKLSVGRRLEKLLDGAGREAERLAVLEGLAQMESDPVERRRVLGQCARLAERLDDGARALGFWQLRLEEDASDLEALDALIELTERLEDWERHVDALRRRVTADVPAVQRRLDLSRIAQTQAGRLAQLDAAIETWNTIQSEFGEDHETVDSLFDLLVRAERYDEIYGVLDRATKRDANRAAEVLARLGDVSRAHLGRADDAAKAYHRAIVMEPGLERAQRGLGELLEDEGARGSAVRGLAKAYELTDDWRAMLGLLEPRLEAALDDSERVELLREAATFHESRGEDPSAAFDAVRRALAYAPPNPELEGELLRLAEATGRGAEAAEALGAAAASLVETRKPRAAALLRRQAALFEATSDPRALDAWLAALELDPHDATTAREAGRVGAAADRWDGASRAATMISAAKSAMQDALFDELEQSAEQAGALDRLADGVAAAVEARPEIDPGLGLALHRRVAVWLRDRVEAPDRAEAALSRALAFEPNHVATLRDLAALQRRAPSRALVETLLRLADNSADDLDPLHEAATLALGEAGDTELARSVLERLHRTARRLWEGTGAASGERDAGEMAVWSLEELVRIALASDDAARAVDLLVDGARMPVDQKTSRDMRRRAGALSRDALGDADRAMRLQKSVVDESVEDAAAVDGLCLLFEERGRLPELLALRQRQLALELDDETRFAARLEVARILGAIEAQGGRIAALRQNLQERPGHAASVERLGEIYASRTLHAELAELFTTQAEAVEEQGESPRAADLWSRAARLFDDELGDVERAMKAHRRVVALEPTRESLDALARMHMDRGEPGVAAEWLKRRYETAEDEERSAIALRLAEAHLAAGHAPHATQVLERVLAADPTASEARERLAGLYRASDAYEPLARLLAEGAPHEQSEEKRLAYVREAANLYEHKLDQPDQAIPVLEMGVELAPDDNDLKSKLALGLRVAGRLDEARAILEVLSKAFGRRRSPERAAVHFQLAQVAHAGGELSEAMKQLEKARKMDMSHPGILRMAGRMALEAGQLDKAEKSYRALLLVVRRQDPGSDEVKIGASEVLYELSLLATQQDDVAQAEELLETAMATASEHDRELERFKNDLVERGEHELALTAIEKRLAAVDSPESEATMLSHRADVLRQLGRSDESFDALIKAVELAPAVTAHHDRCRALAKEMGQTARYIATLENIAQGARRSEDAAFAASVLLRLGEVTERDLGDLDAASALYKRVEELGVRVEEAWQALARVADARGDGAEEVRVLRRLVEADAAIPNEARTQALYRIAEVELAGSDLHHGLATLRDALEREPRYSRAGAILQGAAQPDIPGRGEENLDALLEVYRSVSRESGDPQMILDYLERRVTRPDATLEQVREGVERADAVDAPERAEALLRIGVDLAREREGGLREALWIPLGLSDRRRDAGDIAGALEWMQTAAEVADEAEAYGLHTKIAVLAASDGGDLQLAAQTYRSLLANDPSNRELWEPLAGVYAKLEDREGLEEVVSSTLDALLDPADRNELRMFYGAFLLDVAQARGDAIAVFKDVLDEDPDHDIAAQKLADLFEESGDAQDLVDLLHRQLDRARDRQDIDAIVELSLRMGRLIEAEDPSAAVDFYRGGLDWAPESRELLAALLTHYGPEAEPRERAELMERLLAVSTGAAGSQLANELIAAWNALDDEYAAARALDLGFRANPADPDLRQRLEAYYHGREEWSELAEMICYDAEHREDDVEAVARFAEAASIYGETLASPGQAAEVRRKAWQRQPDNLALLEQLVTDLVAAGLQSAASEDVGGALEHHGEPTEARAHLLRMRAELERSLGNATIAVRDLEEAYAITPGASAQALVAGLDAQRNEAAARADMDEERQATHRLAAVLTEAGNPQQGRDVLAEWVERDPNDRAALRTLRAVDSESGNTAAVASHNARLVAIEEGEDQVEAALGLVAAARAMEQPERAREGLELVAGVQPSEPRVQAALRELYETIGAHAELARYVLADANAAEDPEERFTLFRRAGDLLIQIGDAEGALEPLAQAAQIQPEDHDLAILLADAYMGSGRLHEAVELLQNAIAGFKRRRSPHLAAMQLRMARIAGVSGDPETQKEWLSVALDADKNNGEVAAELAELAMELGDDEAALKALRVVTLQKAPGPMSKAVAFLRQAQIVYRQGDAQKAVLWARRARLEDDQLEEAQEFLAQLGEA